MLDSHLPVQGRAALRADRCALYDLLLFNFHQWHCCVLLLLLLLRNSSCNIRCPLDRVSPDLLHAKCIRGPHD